MFAVWKLWIQDGCFLSNSMKFKTRIIHSTLIDISLDLIVITAKKNEYLRFFSSKLLVKASYKINISQKKKKKCCSHSEEYCASQVCLTFCIFVIKDNLFIESKINYLQLMCMTEKIIWRKTFFNSAYQMTAIILCQMTAIIHVLAWSINLELMTVRS